MTDGVLQADIPFERFAADTEKLIRPRRSKFGRLPFGDLDKPGPEHEWIIDGFLSVGDVSVIAGPSGSGKSFLAIHASMCIARGRPFFGADVDRPGLVLYQAGEGVRGIKKRLRAYRQHEEIDAGEKVAFELLQSPINLMDAQCVKDLIDEIKWIASEYPDLPLIAVFIDTFATATPGADENGVKDMTVVLTNVQRIARECRCHVCLVHHMNASGEKLRGHTSIKANIDQVITVKVDRSTGIRSAILDKQKDEEDGHPFRFELMRLELGVTPKGKPITSCICAPVGEKAAEAAAREAAWMRLGPTFHTAMLALVAAMKKVGRTAPQNIDAPSWAEVVSLTAWRDEFSKLKSGEDEDPDKLKERVKKARDRAVEKFLAHNLIGKHGDWVWRTKRKIFGIDRAPAEPRIAEMPPDLMDDLSRMDDPLF